MSTLKIIDNTVIKAVDEYLSRKSRETHPDGYFEHNRYWYPGEKEACEDCRTIRKPSYKYPYSLMTHCRSMQHIANKYKLDASVMRKVSAQVLRREKKGEVISILEAATIVIDKNKNYVFDKLLRDN